MSKTFSGSMRSLPLALTLHMKPFCCVTSTSDVSSDQFAVFDLSSEIARLSSAHPIRQGFAEQLLLELCMLVYVGRVEQAARSMSRTRWRSFQTVDRVQRRALHSGTEKTEHYLWPEDSGQRGLSQGESWAGSL